MSLRRELSAGMCRAAAHRRQTRRGWRGLEVGARAHGYSSAPSSGAGSVMCMRGIRAREYARRLEVERRVDAHDALCRRIDQHERQPHLVNQRSPARRSRASCDHPGSAAQQLRRRHCGRRASETRTSRSNERNPHIEVRVIRLRPQRNQRLALQVEIPRSAASSSRPCCRSRHLGVQLFPIVEAWQLAASR